MTKPNTLSKPIRIMYIYISIALFLLFPSIYGIKYCFVSEKLIKIVPLLEKVVIETIDQYENGRLVCQQPVHIKVKKSDLTPKKIVNGNFDIRSGCSAFGSAGFSIELADYIYPVLKLNIGYTKHIETLRFNIFELSSYTSRMEMRKLYCYHSKYDDHYDDLKKGFVPPKKDNETFAERTFRERCEEEFKDKYGEPLEVRKKNAKINHAKHISTLKDYLDKIQAARLAHEPHRPMIRFIGWFWLFFEIIGMILVFGGAFLQLRQIIKKRQKKYPRLSDFRDDDEF